MITSLPRLPESPLVVFAGGGTGGHLYPALAVAEAIRSERPDARFTFLASPRAVDQRVLGEAGMDTVAQPLRPIGRAPWTWATAYLGYRDSRRLCRHRFQNDRPAVVVGTGGLSSVPAIREAAKVGITTAILNPDAVPGRANRYLARYADAVFVQWEDSVPHFPRTTTVIVSGCPTRTAFHGGGDGHRIAGIARFGLKPQLRTLLVTGASQGARTINRSLVANLDLLERFPDWQVLHLTGESDFGETQDAYARRRVPAAVLAYTHHMGEALAAADLVIARAGASFLAELTALGRASILMPYPYHRDQHQLANARCLERQGAARIVPDRIELELNEPMLRAALEELMAADGAREEMALRARQAGRRDASATIGGHLLRIAAGSALRRTGETLQPS